MPRFHRYLAPSTRRLGLRPLGRGVEEAAWREVLSPLQPRVTIAIGGAEDKVYERRILLADLADGQRGLLFLCYQTSIRGQFEILNNNKWMNRQNGPQDGGTICSWGRAARDASACCAPLEGRSP